MPYSALLKQASYLTLQAVMISALLASVSSNPSPTMVISSLDAHHVTLVAGRVEVCCQHLFETHGAAISDYRAKYRHEIHRSLKTIDQT